MDALLYDFLTDLAKFPNDEVIHKKKLQNPSEADRP